MKEKKLMEQINLCKSNGSVIGDQFISLWHQTCIESYEKENKWIEYLKSKNIKASHPDDGWVNREKNYIQFCYPHFKENIQIGDFIALGSYRKYRIVKIIKIEKSILSLTDHDNNYYFFEKTES
jgi:hypothetical protein